MRALAMSILSVSAATPTASTLAGSVPSSHKQQVEIVDHEVEDDVDVGRARGERRQPVDLDETRGVHGADSAASAGLNRSVCPTMTRRERRARGVENGVGIVERRRDRLFDQHVGPTAKQRESGRAMIHRRRRDARGGRRAPRARTRRGRASQPYSAAIFCARSKSRSATPTSVAPGSAAYRRAW